MFSAVDGRWPSTSKMVSAEVEREIVNFLYFEAELLDDWRFRDWLILIDEGMEYTMPTQSNALTRDRLKSISPPTNFYFCENKAQLEQRVRRLETGMAWAEEPPSRTRHIVTNIRVAATGRPANIHRAQQLPAVSPAHGDGYRHLRWRSSGYCPARCKIPPDG